MSSAAALPPGVAYVRASGSGEEKALLKVLLREPLTDADLEAVTEQQNPDGGFRVAQLKEPQSVVGRTAEKLLYIAALGAQEFGAAQAAADFLIECQRPDGSWGERDSLRAAGPPPYFEPGSVEVAGWETAAAIVALAGMGFPLDFRSALEFLRAHRIAPGTPRIFRLELILLYCAFHRGEAPDSPTARNVRAELEAISSSSLEVFELNWGLLALSAAGLASSDPLVRAWGSALAKKERPDGSFGSGPNPSPYETVLALCALDYAGAIKIPRGAPSTVYEPDPATSDHGI